MHRPVNRIFQTSLSFLLTKADNNIGREFVALHSPFIFIEEAVKSHFPCILQTNTHLRGLDKSS